MNKVRILNYLIKKEIVKKDYDPIKGLRDNLLVDLDTFYLFVSKNRFRQLEIELIEANQYSLADVIRILFDRSYKVPLDSCNYNKELTIKIDHDLEPDDLDLGKIKLYSYDIDWDHSFEDYNVQLLPSGIDKVYEELPYTRLYSNLNFSIV